MGEQVGKLALFFGNSQLDVRQLQSRREDRGSDERTFLPAAATLLAVVTSSYSTKHVHIINTSVLLLSVFVSVAYFS